MSNLFCWDVRTERVTIYRDSFIENLTILFILQVINEDRKGSETALIKSI